LFPPFPPYALYPLNAFVLGFVNGGVPNKKPPDPFEPTLIDAALPPPPPPAPPDAPLSVNAVAELAPPPPPPPAIKPP
jgi:hypothetical protein